MALVTFANWLHPAIAGPGFVLAGIGLNGLYKRLEIDTTPGFASNARKALQEVLADN